MFVSLPGRRGAHKKLGRIDLETQFLVADTSSYHWINQYVGSKKYSNHRVSCMFDFLSEKNYNETFYFFNFELTCYIISTCKIGLLIYKIYCNIIYKY